MPNLHRAALCAALLLPATATAQDQVEYTGASATEPGDQALEVSGSFSTEWHEFDNLDFRPYDDSSDQAVLDSDDRGSLAFTGAELDLGYQIDGHTRFVLNASHRGLWGNDQLGNADYFSGLFYFGGLYVDITTGTMGDGVLFRIGRQYFELGALGGANDYILSDVLDMIRVDVPLGSIGSLVLIPINVVSMSADADGENFISYLGQGDLRTFNFQGGSLTRRHGLVLDFAELGPAHAVGYAFYTDIGATVTDSERHLYGSGVDIGYDGALGNFLDGDSVANFGLRASAELGPVTPFAHLDFSSGIDRKELVASDANTNGTAFGLGITADTRDEDSDSEAGLKADLSFFNADGPWYADTGLLFSHGYVGMKGAQIGGPLLNRYMGWHPSAYVDVFGVSNTPQNMARKAGTRVVHAGAEYELDMGLSFSADWWFAQDTGLSNVQFANLDELTPPFGYSRSEFAAQERLGEVLAQELDFGLGYRASKAIALFGTASYVIPGAFQEFKVERVAGTNLGYAGFEGPSSPWAVSAGTQVEF